MAEELLISPSTTLRVLSHTEEQLVLEARYAGGTSPPPAHLHPAQDERFEVLSGAMRATVDGRERELASGDTLEVPRGTPHQLWNDGEQEAMLAWVTMPAGRTLEFFREVAALSSGTAAAEAGGTLLERYSDVFRLAQG